MAMGLGMDGMTRALGWTLLHFCWEGAAVAGLLWCALALMPAAWARTRYGAAVLALGLMVAVPAGTFWRLTGEELAARKAMGNAPAQVLEALAVTAGGDGAHVPLRVRVEQALDAAAGWVPAVWLSGVVFFLVRLNLGLAVARRMRAAAAKAVPEAMEETLVRLRRRLGIRRPVRLLCLADAALVQVPTVIGWLKPVVLVPVGCLAGMSAAQAEAVLAHELAHVRRHDYLVSVLQGIVEALLFYQPAVWWVSRQVRRERESCCDDVAVRVAGDRIAYARALSWLEEYRAGLPEIALGANGGVLTMRIRRLLGIAESSVASRAVAAMLLAGSVALSGGYAAVAARAQGVAAAPNTTSAAAPAGTALGQANDLIKAPDPDPLTRRLLDNQRTADTKDLTHRLSSVYQTWLDQDVVWIITPEERAAFLKLSEDAERHEFIQSFWLRRDAPGAPPNSFRNEHYARIAYANRHFATDQRPGWKTDRGRIYILYGKPEAIESHPGDTVNFPFEVWHYGRVGAAGGKADLDFVDLCLCGDYHFTVNPRDKEYFPGHGLTPKETAAPAVQAKRVAYAAQVLAPPAVSGVVEQTPIRVSAGVMAGQIVSRVDPVYPPIAKAAGVSGAVVLHAVISKTGTVENLTVVSGPQMLMGAALDAVKQWTYKPYLLNGQPVEVDTTITVNFMAGGAAGPNAGPMLRAAAPEQAGEGDTRAARVPGGVMAGNIVSRVNPVYPAAAKAAGVQGTVVLRAVIGKTGAVEKLTVVSGPEELQASAIDAVKQWVYRPYLLNGQPTEVDTTITVNYTLGDGTGGAAAEAGTDRQMFETGVADMKAGRQLGPGISPPVVVSTVNPEYTAEARVGKVSGNVLVGLWVDENGQPQQVHVERGFGLRPDGTMDPAVSKTVADGLNEKAIEAVKQNRFKPAMQDGKPVTVVLHIEVNFQVF
jgi:TonB family protein